MIKKQLIIATLLLFLPFLANSKEKYEFIYKNRKAPIFVVDEHLSQANTIDEFSIEISEKIKKFTEENEKESCAIICQSGKKWGAIIFTANSHSYCPIINKCPHGYTASNIHIHGHIKAKKYKPNMADIFFIGISANNEKLETLDPDQFSDDDFLSGSGYLVSANGVFYQNGRGTERVVIKF